MNAVLTALLIPFLGTALGSAFVFFMRKEMPERLQAPFNRIREHIFQLFGSILFREAVLLNGDILLGCIVETTLQRPRFLSP